MRTALTQWRNPSVLPIAGALTLLTTTTGCWPGHRMADWEFKYKHQAVPWVYRTGGQVAFTMLVPNIIQNRVHDLQVEGTNVYVTEGGPGCITSSFFRPTYKLDLSTGRSLPAWPPKHHDQQNCVRGEWNDVAREWSVRVDPHSSLVAPAAGNAPALRSANNERPDFLLFELLPGQRCIPGCIAELPNDVFVVRDYGGYVICLDLKLIPGYPFKSQSTTQDSPPSAHVR